MRSTHCYHLSLKKTTKKQYFLPIRLERQLGDGDHSFVRTTSSLLHNNVRECEVTCTISLSVLVAEHLLSGAGLLLLWGGRLTLEGLARVLGLVLELCSLLRDTDHRGHLAALSHGHRPPGQSWALQLMAHGVDQGGDINEVGY